MSRPRWWSRLLDRFAGSMALRIARQLDEIDVGRTSQMGLGEVRQELHIAGEADDVAVTRSIARGMGYLPSPQTNGGTFRRRSRW